MDPISHELFKYVVGTEFTIYYRHNPAKIRDQSLKKHWGEFINAGLVNRIIEDWLLGIEDPLYLNVNEETLYDIVFDLFHNLNQFASGVYHDEEYNMATSLVSKLKKEAHREKLIADGIDEDMLDVLDI